MRIAIIYNRESKNVINLFGIPNREKYGLKNIKRIVDALKKSGHQVIALEGDKDLVPRLEEFMPKVLKGELPGMVFNLSYGIQGQARYTHVPGILEMVGIPYVGSGPLAHSLSLDKVVAKMIFKQSGLPTPDFAVLDAPGFEMPDLKYPLIVKPKNEAVSYGIKIVNNESELRDAADKVFEAFQQPVLLEQYIDGREINVGLLGNTPPEAFPPVELLFGEGGPKIYTLEDKKGSSGRKVSLDCPAPIGEELSARAKELAIKAFSALGCYDCARVDMRLDAEGNLYILEINSLPSLGARGSYARAAEEVGLDFTGLIARLVEVASSRYFGTPTPPSIGSKARNPQTQVLSFLTQRRDRIEKRLKEWTDISSRTSDPVGLSMAVKELNGCLRDIGLVQVGPLTDDRSVWTWETRAGLDDGTLLVGHLDVPLQSDAPSQAFRREPEWLTGEGIGISRGPLVMMEFALRALRHQRSLRGLPVGVLYYTDEGRDCRYSAELIQRAARRAKRVLVLRPCTSGSLAISGRRGQRKYHLVVDGDSRRLGQAGNKPEPLLWLSGKLQELAALSSRKKRIAVSASELDVKGFPMRLPHRVTTTLLVGYPKVGVADEIEEKMRKILGRAQLSWHLQMISDRPPLIGNRSSTALAKKIGEVAETLEIPFGTETSVWPSVAGIAPLDTAALCGMGPVARDLYTPNEAVERISLLQRTLLLSSFLAADVKRKQGS